MQKPIIYASIPEFDQATQAVFQLPPEEMDDHIFVGVVVVDVEPVEGEIVIN